jgi:cytochrome c-type biogenesis protein CcmE
MRHRNIKVGVTVIVLVGAFLGLLWSTVREGTEYYKHVDEVMSNPHEWQGKRLQLHGFAFDVKRKPDSLDWRFKVRNNDSVVNVTYSGIVPDTFKDDAEVVLKGRLEDDGFHTDPNGIMVKCPSKYDPAQKPIQKVG